MMLNSGSAPYLLFYRDFPAVKKGIFEGDRRYFYYIINTWNFLPSAKTDKELKIFLHPVQILCRILFPYFSYE